MPISLSAKKSLRKSLKNRKENVVFKNKLKVTVKSFLTKPSEKGLKEVYSILDRAVKKNIFHKNKVARLKSMYTGKLGKKAEPKASVKEVSSPKKKTTKRTVKKM